MATSYDDGTRTGPRRIETRDDARPSMAAPFLGLGGLALVIGSLLTWIDAGDATTGTTEIGGSSLSDDRIVMGIGSALLVMALYMGPRDGAGIGSTLTCSVRRWRRSRRR